MRCHSCEVMTAHVRCLAKRFLLEGGEPSEVIPYEGRCPRSACAQRLLWATLVREAITYRPLSSTELNPTEPAGRQSNLDDEWENGGDVGDQGCDSSPRVWRADDSSDDDENDASEYGGGSENGSQDDVGFAEFGADGCDVFSDASAEPTDAGENAWPFARVDDHSCSRGKLPDSGVRGIAGSTSHGRWRLKVCRDHEPAGSNNGGRLVDLPRSDGSDVVFHRDDGPAERDGQEGNEQRSSSPPILPLAERLRLRRLAAAESDDAP